MTQGQANTPPPRCDQCAEFSARIGTCSDAERPRVEMAQRRHIEEVKAMRTLQTRLGCLSAESTASVGSQSLLKIDLDGLDQAKTKWPRNLSAAKQLATLWRPNLHLVGFVAHGVSWQDKNERNIFSIYSMFRDLEPTILSDYALAR